MPFGFFGPELMATLIQPNPRNEKTLPQYLTRAYNNGTCCQQILGGGTLGLCTKAAYTLGLALNKDVDENLNQEIGLIQALEEENGIFKAIKVETPLHPEKLTVWCALWAGGIGPYFFKNDEGHNVTVNGDRYRAMITNFFTAHCHTARATIDLLKDTFSDRLISRFGPVNWPPRSCDLTPLDYFLWGYVKSLVYADKPQTLDHLEDNIRRVIADIRPQMLEKVIENWTSRLDYIRASRGSPMPEIIFKIGTCKPKGKGLKNLKSQGSAKIGISCPAVIKVRQSTENVLVKYFPKHQNHETQLEYLTLAESDRTAIAGIEEGTSEKNILQDIREEITVDSGRKMLIGKKDIHNIKKDFNINGYVKRHGVDAVSVKLWAQEMKNNGENCIVFFKEQEQSGNDYCLKDEDFVLVIMTDFQKEMITKYGMDKICIDGTHGLNTHTQQ
ncbi:MULE domain-containing protein [Trichonephila clavipes]|nr:MULE domain-containing protein [Trichonephila clavipes]